MDLNAIGAFVVTYVVKQWPFFFAAFLLGVAGQVFKSRVWTIERARKSKVFWWIRVFLPFHAPFFGFLLGWLLWMNFGEQTPTGPDIDGKGAILLYYTGAGAISSWLFSAFKHVLWFKFGVKPPTELDDDDSMRPPDERPTPPDSPMAMPPRPPSDVA